MNKISIGLLAGILSVFFSANLKAQSFEAASNDHDDLPYYFGLTFGYNNSFLHTTRSEGFYTDETNPFRHVEPKGSGGIELGLIGTVKLADHWELRTVPKLIIGGSKSLTYYYKDGQEPKGATNELDNTNGVYSENMKLPQTMISVPLHIKFLSDRIGNVRAYLFAGPKYDFNLSANSEEYTKERENNNFPAPQFRKGSFGIEGGIGVHIYLPFAVISPEIRMGTSLQNDHILDVDNPYSNAFNQIKQRMLSFSINIEQ